LEIAVSAMKKRKRQIVFLYLVGTVFSTILVVSQHDRIVRQRFSEMYDQCFVAGRGFDDIESCVSRFGWRQHWSGNFFIINCDGLWGELPMISSSQYVRAYYDKDSRLKSKEFVNLDPQMP
jgi:hypothetical protein